MTPAGVAPPPVRAAGAPVVRPRDAATLIVCRRGYATFELLMGKRHDGHRFFPQRYVFPGGRVDAADSRIRPATPLRADVAAQLQRKLTPARARAMAVAAVRETFEETGLIIGAPNPAPDRGAPRGWQSFFATGFAPSLHDLRYIARAVTPPRRPIRFNARFFMIDARRVAGDLEGSGELLDLRWFSIPRALDLELANITRRVLAHLGELLADPPPPSASRPIPYFKQVGDGHVRIDE